MISLSISNGTATPLSIVDTGQSGYVVANWSNGKVEYENTVATSRWVDGGVLTSSRKAITAMDLTVRVWGTSYSDLMGKIDTLGSAVGQFGYTVTEAYSGGSAVYTCMPAGYEVDLDPSTLRANMAMVHLSIPRQP